MMAKISQCEIAMEQALLIQLMNLEQSDMYDQLLKDIGRLCLQC